MPEFLDVVDKNNHVIGKEERSIVHKKKLFHRSVCVFILNKENNCLSKQGHLSKMNILR